LSVYREKEGGTEAEHGRDWRKSVKGMSWKQCREGRKDSEEECLGTEKECGTEAGHGTDRM
jgi:hypothetical protein